MCGCLAAASKSAARRRRVWGEADWPMLRRAPTGPSQRAQRTLEEHDGRERADVAVGDALSLHRKVVRRTLEVSSDSLDAFKVGVTHEQRPISQIVFSVVPQARRDLALGRGDVEAWDTLKKAGALSRKLATPQHETSLPYSCCRQRCTRTVIGSCARTAATC